MIAEADRSVESESLEYAWVSGWMFRRKRVETLAQFLARPNLQRSISALKPWWLPH